MSSLQRQLQSHPHWPAVEFVLKTLHQNGFKALLAGGCVRDALLSRPVHDFDVATSAHPNKVEELFAHSNAVGKSFGVIIVNQQGVNIEVTTFRSDGPYLDGRHPSGVVFSTPQEDAERRDFTVNGLFYDVQKEKVVDYVDGLSSLKQKEIKCIGEAKKRFTEDRLRLLRAVRLATQLEFEIENNTWKAILDQSDELKVVSVERLQAEVFKIFKSPFRRRGLQLLVTSNLWPAVFPHWNLPLAPKAEAMNLWLKALWMSERLEAVNDKPTAGLSVLALHQWQWEKDLKKIELGLQFLKLSRETLRRVLFVVGWYEKLLSMDLQLKKGLRLGQAVELAADPAFDILMFFWELEEKLQNIKSATLEELKTALARHKKDGQLTKAFLDGEDLKKLGVAPGARMGELLKESYYLQLEDQLKTREEALAWLKTQI